MTPKKKPAENQDQATPEQVQQAVAVALQSYFTPEINARINEMTQDEMFMHLRNLVDTEAWFALLKYNNARLLIAQSVVNQADPVVNPTSIARTQGIMTGLIDVQNFVIQLVETEKQVAQAAQELRDEAAANG